MSEEKVQDSVQEVATESQSEPAPSNQDADLLREVMQKKERLQKAEAQVAKLEAEKEQIRKAQMAKNDEWKTLYEETQAKLDNALPELKSYKERENADVEKMLKDFPEEDREAFVGMNYQQLKVVHSKIINKPNNVPSVGSEQPATTEGYKSIIDVAEDFQTGKITESAYNRIKSAFRKN